VNFTEIVLFPVLIEPELNPLKVIRPLSQDSMVLPERVEPMMLRTSWALRPSFIFSTLPTRVTLGISTLLICVPRAIFGQLDAVMEAELALAFPLKSLPRFEIEDSVNTYEVSAVHVML